MLQYGLIHNRKGIIGKDGKALIQIRAYDRKRYKFLSTEIRIESKQWDKEKMKVNANHAQYIKLNRILESKISRLEDYEISLASQGKECSLNMIEQFHLNGKVTITFNEFVDYELKNSTLSSGTIRQQKVFYNKLNEFSPNTVFSQIDYDFCCRFEKFLVDKKLHQNSIAKEFKNFKKFVNLAVAKDYMEVGKNPFLKYKVKSVPSKKIHLTSEELNRIEELEFTDWELENARDIYLFGAYTGLRYGDISSLKKSDIIKLEDGSWNLDIRMRKTSNLLLLPLHKLFNGRPKELIQKHNEFHKHSEKCFKCYSNEHQNRLLKLIAKLANIDKRLAFHSSRHSFGTNLLNHGIRIEVVQGLMGHTKIQQTQEYAQLLNISVNRELDKVW